MVNVGYHTARLQGRFLSVCYQKVLPWIANFPIQQTQRIDIDVYSFSCERDLATQVANIRTFIRHVGIPDKFIVISDGTYTAESRKLLCKIHPCVDVIEWKDLVKEGTPEFILHHALEHPQRATKAMWRRMAVFNSLSIEKPTLYTDADILFFPGASNIIDLCQQDNTLAWYLPDCKFSLDDRILLQEEEKLNPVNAGFFLLKKQLDWEKPLKRVAKLIDSPVFFTDQTVVHLAMHDANAKPLNEQLFVLRLSDQFLYQDTYSKKHIAMRHYVSDIRHKFWFYTGV